MDTRNLTLAAGATSVITGGAMRFFMLLETTSAVTVRLYALANGGGNVEEAESVTEGYTEWAETDEERFQRIEIYSAAAQTIKYGTSQRTVANNVLKGNVTLDPYGSLDGLAPVSFTVSGQNKTIAANAARKVIDLIADPANTGIIYVGSVDASKGIPLAAGQSYPDLQVTGVIELWGTVSGDKLHLAETL